VPDASASPYQGRLIGHYRLRQRIGEGGMGEVYLGEREDQFRQRVAVKLIRPGMASPEVVRRFVIERQTLAALNHPHIVRLVDGGATEDGLPYLVVDYVDGIPIDRYCDQHKLSISQRLRLFVESCVAVHHAHQSLIVHCDLKPGNILVTPEGSPMLLDFGIAKLLDPAAMGISAQAALTRQRAFTPDYASPEQLRGEPVTTATDIYALGVVLYELLTGHSPYRANAGSLADWIRSVCEQDAEPPSTVIRRTTQTVAEDDRPTETITPETVSQSREGDPQSLHRRLRGDLDAIVLKALRKDPHERYGSVDQLAEDIRRHLAGLPVLARKSTTAYVARKFFQRHKLGVAAAAVVLLTLAAGLASTLWESHVAARRFEDVRRLAHTFLFDVHDSIQDLPGSTPARALIARTGTEYLDRLASGSRGDPSLALELAEGYDKIADVEGNVAGSNLGKPIEAIASYRKALALSQSVLAGYPADRKARQVVAQSHEGLGLLLAFQGKAAEGLDHFREAMKLRQTLAASDPQNVELRLDLDRAYEDQGDILGGARGINLGRTAEARDAYQKALALIPDLPPGHPSALRARRAKAVLLMKLADIERAADAADSLVKYASSLETADAILQADPNSMRARNLVTALLNKLAFVKAGTGDLKGALLNFQRAVDIDYAALAADPNNDKARSDVVVTLKNLADLYYYEMNSLPEALRCYRKAAEYLEIQVRADAGNIVWQQNLSEIVTDIASILLSTGQPREARVQAQRGLELAKAVADRTGATGDQVYNYAWLAVTVDPADLRDPAGALPYALKALEKGKGEDPLCLHVLALAYAGTGDYRRAVETEQKALALFAPVEAGKPAPRNRGIIDRALEGFRRQLATRGG
jgi:non-specific serine/threonine protein kinase/serine/threonine-protein kinase